MSFTLQSQPIHVQHISELDGVGITSILPLPLIFTHYPVQVDDNSNTICVGTKRGKIVFVMLHQSDGVSTDSEKKLFNSIKVDLFSEQVDTSGFELKSYPIYSMIDVQKHSSNNIFGIDVLAGGGDRYITVWECTGKSESENNKLLKMKQQLGPHTGWVRDLALSNHLTKNDNECNNDRRVVFSIGCNCVEVWIYNKEIYDHLCKLQIESSVDMGSTLSSDLLCLATYSCNGNGTDSGEHDMYLVAGGVDGRLHRWKAPESVDGLKKSSEFQQKGVISAHNGRVNNILICETFGALVTVGSDGCLNCKMMTNYNPFEKWETFTLNLNYELCSESSIKLTCSCIVSEVLSHLIVSIGSS
jgi:hypothetical protein